jgi:hypothetical protein
VRIPPDNERNLLRPSPSFQLLFTGESLVHVVIRFPIEQASYVIPVRESLKVMEFVLEDATVKVAA